MLEMPVEIMLKFWTPLLIMECFEEIYNVSNIDDKGGQG